MLPAERTRIVAELVVGRDWVPVSELRDQFGEPNATGQGILHTLDAVERPTRCRGATILQSSCTVGRSDGHRDITDLDTKRALPDRATDTVRDEDVVLFDAGPTTTSVVRDHCWTDHVVSSTIGLDEPFTHATAPVRGVTV